MAVDKWAMIFCNLPFPLEFLLFSQVHTSLRSLEAKFVLAKLITKFIVEWRPRHRYSGLADVCQSPGILVWSRSRVEGLQPLASELSPVRILCARACMGEL